MKKPCSPVTVCFILLAFASSGLGQSEKKISPIPSATEPKIPVTAPKAVPIAAPKAVPEVKKYVVQSGDNPWLIAKNHGVSLEELLKANTIKDAKNLKIGDEIVIPARGGAPKSAPVVEVVKTSAQPGATAPVPTASDSWDLYTIKSGDNPWKIAKSLKVEHQKILSLNEGVDFQKLQIGQQIKVPKKS